MKPKDKNGRLTLIQKKGKDKWGKILWRCKCQCGNNTIVMQSNLKRTHSCGCLKKEQLLASRYKGCKKLSMDAWSSLIRGAKARDIPFSISIKYAWKIFEQQKGKCALSGLEILLSHNKKKVKPTASLDRIDSSKGYVKGNIQWVHKNVNMMKWKLSQQEFLKLCTLIAKYTN